MVEHQTACGRQLTSVTHDDLELSSGPFVAEADRSKAHPCTDEAVLLCSELVTNAVLHSDSGQPGGAVTVVVLGLPGAVRGEVVDNGSSLSTPVVKAEVYEPDGHGLFLVEQLAENWGYTRDEVGTTVWFRLTC